MATCKVLSKPDYELTLSSEEKKALYDLLKKQSTNSQMGVGLTSHQASLNDGLYNELSRCS